MMGIIFGASTPCKHTSTLMPVPRRPVTDADCERDLAPGLHAPAGDFVRTVKSCIPDATEFGHDPNKMPFDISDMEHAPMTRYAF